MRRDFHWECLWIMFLYRSFFNIQKKLFQFCAILLIISVSSLIISSCGGAQESVFVPDPESPPPPPPAPASVVEKTRGSTIVTASGPSNGSAEFQGTPVPVLNQDPGGSGSYKFTPSEFNFKVGDEVAFTMTAESEFHTFTVDSLGIDEGVDLDESVSFSYTFDKAGTYELVCTVHFVEGMTGTIIVTE